MHFMLVVNIHIIIEDYRLVYFFRGQLLNHIFKGKMAGLRHLQVEVGF